MADDDKFEYVTHRLDSLDEKISDIKVCLGSHIAKFDSYLEDADEQRAALKRNTEILNRNTASLEHHIERTDLLEKYVKKIDERFTPLELETVRRKAISEWMKDKVLFLGKLGGAIAALGALATIAKVVVQYLATAP